MENIGYFWEELEGEATSQAQHNLFYVNKDAELLDKNNIIIFTA